MDISTAAARTQVYEPFSPASPFSSAPRHEPMPADDSISVSRDGRLIHEAIKSASATPDLRRDKIAAIRERIANGTYEIDAKRIAKSLIREEPGLFRL